MENKPWHLCRPYDGPCDPTGPNKNTFGNHSLADFLRQPLRDHGEPLPGISHNDTNPHYLVSNNSSSTTTNSSSSTLRTNSSSSSIGNSNIYEGGVLQIRAHKLRLMQQVRKVAPFVKVIHFRDFEAAPNRVIIELEEEFGLQLSPLYRNLNPSKKIHRQPCLTETDHAVLMETIDWDLEAQFSFSPSECRLCLGPAHRDKEPVPSQQTKRSTNLRRPNERLNLTPP
jgi:hypothetical protein